jgi:hypothetical protein
LPQPGNSGGQKEAFRERAKVRNEEAHTGITGIHWSNRYAPDSLPLRYRSPGMASRVNTTRSTDHPAFDYLKATRNSKSLQGITVKMPQPTPPAHPAHFRLQCRSTLTVDQNAIPHTNLSFNQFALFPTMRVSPFPAVQLL